MKLLDLTLDSPAENIAVDEAILEQAELANQVSESLRLWESPVPLAVIGRSSKVDLEVHRDVCAEDSVPIIRRCSGGAAIVAGPGCLMYGVVLSYKQRPELRSIDAAHCFLMKQTREALARVGVIAACQGACDLTVDNQKISGNSLRCKRNYMLYHGTLLYHFPVEMVDRYLKMPPRQPDYREARPHGQFVRSLDLDREALKQALIDQWSVAEPFSDWPVDATAILANGKYSDDAWNFSR